MSSFKSLGDGPRLQRLCGASEALAGMVEQLMQNKTGPQTQIPIRDPRTTRASRFGPRRPRFVIILPASATSVYRLIGVWQQDFTFHFSTLNRQTVQSYLSEASSSVSLDYQKTTVKNNRHVNRRKPGATAIFTFSSTSMLRTHTACCPRPGLGARIRSNRSHGVDGGLHACKWQLF